MKINVFRLKKFDGKSATKAFVDLIVEDKIVLKGFKLVEGQHGLFLSMPREKGSNDKYFDTIRFQDQNLRDEVEKLCIADFELKGDK